MRLDTTIVRSPFGFTATALAADWHGGDVVAWETGKIRERHDADVAAQLAALPGRLLSVVGGLDKRADDGLTCEWWTVIVFDREVDV